MANTSFYTGTGTSQTLERSVSDAAEDAEKLATNPEDSQYTLSDGTTGYSALHYHAKAEDEKTAAQTAKTAAETARNTAQNHRDDAQKLAINAEDSQFTLADGVTTGYSALHYYEKALDAKTAAETAKSGAQTSETNAASSAGDAADDAADAQKLAINAEDSQYTLSDGTTTGYSALHYAAKAEDHKTAAQAAQAAAEAALDTFDDAFIGAKDTSSGFPTVDNDGNALQDGALMFSTTTDIMYVYDLANTQWLQLTLTSANQANVNTVAGEISPTNNIATVASSISAINDFNDIFFAGATAPSSPSDGDLWYDTANSQLKVYVSTQFEIAADYLQGLTTTHIFTATAAQTNFTTDDASNTMSIYSNGNTLVFKNGVRLIEGTSSTNDYYISGNSVILNSGASAGDVLLVEVFTKISLTQENSLNSLVTQAQTSATNAATSATNAASSASAAAADAVSTAADVVSTNADVVSTNADASSTASDRTAAATSATDAANSASAAATSAAQAAASAGGGTLKISGNDTTADVLENKLTAGTGVTLTKNNSGSNETLSVSVTPFSLTETNATATANQTTFSVTYTTGKLQCFKNGVKLISGSDFTATNGTSVVLASGAAAGDIIEFVVFG